MNDAKTGATGPSCGQNLKTVPSRHQSGESKDHLKIQESLQIYYAGICALQTHLSALVCNKGGERLGIEATVAESQAAVHAVSSQLQGLLTDVILKDRHTQVQLN